MITRYVGTILAFYVIVCIFILFSPLTHAEWILIQIGENNVF